MAEFIDIKRVEIGPKNLIARVRVADGAPLMTSEDLEGTARVYRLLPHIVEHACIGDAGTTFRDAMGNTEIAHLLEHVTVELLAQTDLAGDMPAGRTWVNEVEDRTFEIELACPDDVLVASALSCGVWILDWAYTDGTEPAPDVKAIVAGLVNLVDSVEGEGEDMVVDYPPAEDELDTDETADTDEGEEDEDDLFDEPEADVEPDTPALTPAPAPAPAEMPVPATSTRAERRSLWTPAPVVPTSARPARREAEVRIPEVEAEVDEIMATIEFPVLDNTAATRTVFEGADISELTVPGPAVAVEPQVDPVFEPQPDDDGNDTGGNHIPRHRAVR